MNEKVDHPSHYNRNGAMECIEEMEYALGIDTTMKFCLGNVWKYRDRAMAKNGEEDLRKSDWYMAKYVELRKKLEENAARDMQDRLYSDVGRRIVMALQGKRSGHLELDAVHWVDDSDMADMVKGTSQDHERRNGR